ncbi:hypothetical protein GS429_15250 [Natronorubrum sp. JWXQ-INN-674]|uniref:DUF7344 domain-containing protein n=1 Tax=Natronorubrum halalkaliphilum TaxID=2691917 RepID=A0A6B0VQV7_9EURY|nr:hypothetical protein [Natronorubrum halalkaliphilum]MXV63396.1 hypothetical protein [Natronorubrum halalkaliphilum]
MMGQSDELDRGTVYSLLSDRQREYVLCYLSEAGSATTAEVADVVVRWKRQTMDGADEVSRRTVIIRLLHNHIPRLDQYDVVEYDHSSEEIRIGPNFDAVEPFVSDLEEPISQ